MMLSNKRSIALKGAEAIEAIYGKFADDMRSLIEVKTKDIFQQLIWKQSQFKQVQLGSDYHLEVIDRWNTPASGELSAGERQLLSLAFIAAMAKESGEEAPIVMDTPFGRLSSIPRENITSQLPALTHQLILFITDEEMTENMLANLAGRVGETYLLKFDSTTGCTHIERQ
jgi:DNA sulfur modification protein DndD